MSLFSFTHTHTHTANSASENAHTTPKSQSAQHSTDQAQDTTSDQATPTDDGGESSQSEMEVEEQGEKRVKLMEGGCEVGGGDGEVGRGVEGEKGAGEKATQSPSTGEGDSDKSTRPWFI